MATTSIQGARTLLSDGIVGGCAVAFDHAVTAVCEGGGRIDKTTRVERGDGRLLTPGLIDLHNHGVGPYLYERGPEDLVAGLRLLPRFGVTTVLPTLYRVLGPGSFSLLEGLAEALDYGAGAYAPGFHLEGPFLAIAGAGALTMPADVKYLDELLAACGGKVVAMSVSPEVAGIVPVIERLRQRGVAVFVTHTRATAEQAQAAIDAGARHATHFYDVFPLPEAREPGVRPCGAVEAFLADERTTVDFICDGVHVEPVAVRAALAAKGPDGVVAISDSNVGAGFPAGEYDTPWGYRVRVAPDDAARVADAGHPQFGTLAGSSLTLNAAVANLRRWLPGRPLLGWAMATANPARVIGRPDLGAIRIGSRADLVLWEDRDGVLTPARTWVGGALRYSAEGVDPGGADILVCR